MKTLKPLLLATLMITSMPLYAAAVDSLLQEYQAAGAGPFSVAAGQKIWSTQYPATDGSKPQSCQTCHSTDLKKAGKHDTTGKVIDPMAPSVNPQRLTDVKKINKWFTRNCKQVLGRECSAQEKGDVLTFLRAQ